MAWCSPSHSFRCQREQPRKRNINQFACDVSGGDWAEWRIERSQRFASRRIPSRPKRAARRSAISAIGHHHILSAEAATPKPWLRSCGLRQRRKRDRLRCKPSGQALHSLREHRTAQDFIEHRISHAAPPARPWRYQLPPVDRPIRPWIASRRCGRATTRHQPRS